MKTVGKVLMLLFALAVSVHAFTYLDFAVKNILLTKTEAVRTAIYLTGFYIHIVFAGIALLVGPLQFFPKLRNKYLKQHRTVGKIYVLACILGGLSGLYIAIYSAGGIIGHIGFACLALFWLYTTYKAYAAIRQKNIQEHQIWMIRSFALTMAAVTLRLYLPFLIPTVGYFTTFQIVSWACWIPNLLVVEFFMRRIWKEEHSIALNWV